MDLGNPFNDIGEDELQKAGLKRLSVRLERGEHYVKPDGRPGGTGDAHITPQHEQKIFDMVDENGTPLFDDVADYVNFVSNHWTEVRDNGNVNPILVVRDPSVVKLSGKQNVMILELKETDVAGFYSPKTAAPMKNNYLNKYKVLLEREVR